VRAALLPNGMPPNHNDRALRSIPATGSNVERVPMLGRAVLVILIALGGALAGSWMLPRSEHLPEVAVNGPLPELRAATLKLEGAVAEITKACGDMQRRFESRSRTTEHPSENHDIESHDAIASRLQGIESALRELTSAIASMPRSSAMEFDLHQAPARSQTADAIRTEANRAAKEPAAVTHDLLLLSMADLLQHFGRPDSVRGGSDGQADWTWETEDGYSLEALFTWGRLRWLQGSIPQK
jgi:hypothetical protein